MRDLDFSENGVAVVGKAGKAETALGEPEQGKRFIAIVYLQNATHWVEAIVAGG